VQAGRVRRGHGGRVSRDYATTLGYNARNIGRKGRRATGVRESGGTVTSSPNHTTTCRSWHRGEGRGETAKTLAERAPEEARRLYLAVAASFLREPLEDGPTRGTNRRYSVPRSSGCVRSRRRLVSGSGYFWPRAQLKSTTRSSAPTQPSRRAAR